jgi:hypothetical protein
VGFEPTQGPCGVPAGASPTSQQKNSSITIGNRIAPTVIDELIDLPSPR